MVLDEFMLIGESVLVDKNIGDKVIGVIFNKNGFLKIKVINVGREMVFV